jgi:hypothetical protein
MILKRFVKVVSNAVKSIQNDPDAGLALEELQELDYQLEAKTS